MKSLYIYLFLSALFLQFNWGIKNHTGAENKWQKNIKVILIELGSVKCIPCKKMQVVIKSIDEKYSRSVKTIFYDVWTKEGEKYADQYKVDLIPVQVFLDENKKEFYRHEGFFSEEEIIAVLSKKGIKPNP